MQPRAHIQPIDRLSAADSVISLLSGLKAETISPDERMAVATVQLEAAEEWLAAYMGIEAISAGDA